MSKNLNSLLLEGLKLKASKRTTVSETDVDNLVATFDALVEAKVNHKSTLTVRETECKIGEYSLPTRMVELLSLANVYVSASDYYSTPWFTMKRLGSGKGVVLTPFEVEKFFFEYNLNQSAEYTVPTVEVTDTKVVLSELKALCKGSGLIDLNPMGTISKEAIQIAGILSPFGDAGKLYDKLSDYEVELWLTERKEG